MFLTTNTFELFTFHVGYQAKMLNWLIMVLNPYSKEMEVKYDG